MTTRGDREKAFSVLAGQHVPRVGEGVLVDNGKLTRFATIMHVSASGRTVRIEAVDPPGWKKLDGSQWRLSSRSGNWVILGGDGVWQGFLRFGRVPR